LKPLVRKLLRSFDGELLRFYREEQELVRAHPGMSLRDAIRVQAVATEGQLSIVEAGFLAELVRRSDPARPIIEIGTLFGYSTRVIAAAKARDQQLITVDNYSWNPLGLSADAHRLATRKVLKEAIETLNTTIVDAPAKDFYRQYSGPAPALFFCDADHSYEAVKADLLWARAVNATIICGDDYEPRHQGVTKAVDELGGAAEVQGGLFVLK